MRRPAEFRALRIRYETDNDDRTRNETARDEVPGMRTEYGDNKKTERSGRPARRHNGVFHARNRKGRYRLWRTLF